MDSTISKSQADSLKGGRLVLVTLSLSLGIFMNVLDVSIANVAIPNIAGNLAVSPDQGTWVITSFAVSQAIMLPITGWLAKRFGEVRLFVVSTFLFTVISFLCGLSANLPMLIFFRILQGVVSGPMIPLSQSLLMASYPAEKKGFATGLWAMTAVVGPIAGPVLGGWITDNYSWPWIFYINLPVGLFSSIVTWLMLKDHDTAIVKTKIDVIGLILLIISVGTLQILLDNGNDLDWFHSNIIVTLAIISFIALAFLVAWELTEEQPIIDFTLFSLRNFSVGTTALTLGYMVYFGNVVILPLWLQTQMGYTPTWAGLATAPIGIIPFFLTPFVGQYMNKVDLRMIVSFGFLAFSFTSFWSANFYTEIGYWQIVQPRFIQGLGIAMFFTPLISIVTSELPIGRVASGLGIANFFRILGGSFGTSISVSLWDHREAFHHTRLVENINNFNSLFLEGTQKLQASGYIFLKSNAFIAKTITDQAFMLSTNEIFWLSGWVFLCLLFIVWFAKPPFFTSKNSIAAE